MNNTEILEIIYHVVAIICGSIVGWKLETILRNRANKKRGPISY